MSKETMKKDLLEWCVDFTETMLDELTLDELSQIDAVDTSWCEEWNSPSHYGSYDSIEAAVSSALYSQYVQIMEDRKRFN